MFFIGFLPDKHNGTKKKKRGFIFLQKIIVLDIDIP